MRRDSGDCYDRFVGIRDKDNSPSTNLAGMARGKAFTVLARSRIPEAAVNSILDWLVCNLQITARITCRSFSSKEIIFDGLLGRTLDGFRLCIYADKAKPFNILESYTFSFQYPSNVVGAPQHLVGSIGRDARLRLECPRDAPVLVAGAWSNIQRFMREIHNFHQTLPDLPSQ